MGRERSAVTTAHDAFRQLRSDVASAHIAYESYVEADTAAAAARFGASGEFAATRVLLGDLCGRTVLDLGAGNGIASVAFARAGARSVIALEPDASDLVGRGAISRVATGLPVEIIDALGEDIPLADDMVDVVYARQVLHHARNLDALLDECARVLRSGGTMLASREHVVDDETQLREFLAEHPVHLLTGGEHAYHLDRYLDGFRDAGFRVDTILGPWDSVINAYPTVSTDAELAEYVPSLLRARFGRAGAVLARLPLVESLAWRRLRRPRAGRLYTFLATLPA
jgi:SAM-dependent methyltransferase